MCVYTNTKYVCVHLCVCRVNLSLGMVFVLGLDKRKNLLVFLSVYQYKSDQDVPSQKGQCWI